MSYSQDEVRKVLAEHDGYVVYKPPDDARNWKPCDYMVWWGGTTGDPKEAVSFEAQVRSAWIEVKQNDALLGWNWRLGDASLRPSQLAAMHQALDIGLPYIVAVYWKRRAYWTIHRMRDGLPPAFPFELAVSRYGVGSAPANLGLTLRSVLEGEAGL